MRRAAAPIFALAVFAFVLVSGAVVAAVGQAVGDGHPAAAPWQWWAFVGFLGANLVLLVGGALAALTLVARRSRRLRLAAARH